MHAATLINLQLRYIVDSSIIHIHYTKNLDARSQLYTQSSTYQV